jgi:hypothetical protein
MKYLINLFILICVAVVIVLICENLIVKTFKIQIADVLNVNFTKNKSISNHKEIISIFNNAEGKNTINFCLSNITIDNNKTNGRIYFLIKQEKFKFYINNFKRIVSAQY